MTAALIAISSCTPAGEYRISGTITGADNGIYVVQNGVGDIAIDPTGDVTGYAGDGIFAEDSATGSGHSKQAATKAAAATLPMAIFGPSPVSLRARPVGPLFDAISPVSMSCLKL